MGERESERASPLARRDVLKGATAGSLLGVVSTTGATAGRDGRTESAAVQTSTQRQYRYPVQVVCGRSSGRFLLPGRYRTAISIHNPLVRDVSVRWRVSPTVPAGDPSRSVDVELDRFESVEIDCERIVDLADLRRPVDFLKGFVVVETNVNVDVSAVYSAGEDGTQTLDVVSVSPR